MLPFITADSVAVCYSYISLPLSFLCCRSSLLIQCVFPCCFYVAVHHCWFSGCVLFLHQFTLVVPMLPFITADSVAVCYSYISLPLLFLCCRSSLLIQWLCAILTSVYPCCSYVAVHHCWFSVCCVMPRPGPCQCLYVFAVNQSCYFLPFVDFISMMSHLLIRGLFWYCVTMHVHKTS